MITYLNDPSAVLLKSYPPPFRGTWKTLPPHLLPDDVLQDSLNVTILGGRLRARLGHKLVQTTAIAGNVQGSFLTVDVANQKYPLVATENKVYRLDADTWTDITGTVGLSPTTQARFTSIQIGTEVYILMANGIDEVRYAASHGNLTSITPYFPGGSVPVFTDLCTAASRIVGITPPYTVSWCDVLNPIYLSFTSWPTLNQVILADTEDALVAIRPLGTLGYAIYKEGTIYVAQPQTGPQSAAFRFDFRGEFQGPACPYAIVNWNGTHCYMTPNGRVGVFDGSQHAWVCDGIWPALQTLIDPNYTSSIYGVYNYLTSEITFYFSRVGDNGQARGVLIIDTPYPLSGVQDFSYFLGECNLNLTNGLSVRFYQAGMQPFVWGPDPVSGLTNTYTLDKQTYQDNGVDFSCRIKSGIFRASTAMQQTQIPSRDANADQFRPILEPYLSRDNDRGELELSAVVSQNLESDGMLAQSEIIDLTNTQYPNEYIGYEVSGSFLGYEMQWSSSAKAEMKSCDIYGRKAM